MPPFVHAFVYAAVAQGAGWTTDAAGCRRCDPDVSGKMEDSYSERKFGSRDDWGQWKSFYGINYEWILAECLGSGQVEGVKTGDGGVGVRAI